MESNLIWVKTNLEKSFGNEQKSIAGRGTNERGRTAETTTAAAEAEEAETWPEKKEEEEEEEEEAADTAQVPVVGKQKKNRRQQCLPHIMGISSGLREMILI